MDTLAMLWVNARAAHLLAIRRMTPVEVGNDQEGGLILTKIAPYIYTKSRDIGTFFLPCNTHEDGRGLLGRKS